MTPGGVWDSTQYEIKALLKHEGNIIKEEVLKYAGTPSSFRGKLSIDKKGLYEVIVYAYDPRTGNTGVDRKKVKAF